MMDDLYRQKILQARSILREKGLDCWLMLDRESGTSGTRDPSLELLMPCPVVGLSAFFITPEGCYAVVASYDAHALEETHLFDRVIPYDYDFEVPLGLMLEEIDPAAIGLSYSSDDFTADGITLGLYEKLEKLLAGTPYEDRLVSAEEVILALRGRKMEFEVTRIREACELTRGIWEELVAFLRPGITEMDAMRFIHQRCDELGVQTAWERAWCPGITAGPGSVPGHNAPSDAVIVQEGTLFSIDFGVKKDGYASDLQRTWYVPSAQQPTPPAEVEHAGETLRRAIRAAREAMRPGIPGYEIDAVARQILTSEGYPEYRHALGHQVGRAAHDGGTLLGPRDWPRYAEKSQGILEVGNVFTIEPGIQTEFGRYGAEEMVIITQEGAEWLIEPQEETWIARR